MAQIIGSGAGGKYVPSVVEKQQKIENTYANVRTSSSGPVTGYTGRGNQALGEGNATTSGGTGDSLIGAAMSIYSSAQQRKIAGENRKWQEDQNTLAYERSLPWSSYGPAGSVEFDPETNA